MRLKDKVAVITGSTKAIGAAMASDFAAQGARVVVSGRSEADGAAVVSKIQAKGGKAVFVRADVSREEDIQKLMRAAMEHFGRIDTLINNAYPIDFIMGGGDGPADELSTEKWDYLIKARLYGPFWTCKYAIPEMRKAGGGSIINISSMASKVANMRNLAYCAGKAGLNGLTRQVAVDFGKEGIRSNVIVIGFVLSGVAAHSLIDNPATEPGVRAMSLTRMGRCEDVSNAAIYLASDDAEFIAGVEFPVDGDVLVRPFAPNFSASFKEQG